MKKILFMFSANAKHFKTMAIWILVLAAMPTFSYGQDAAILTPNSPLLAPVDKSIQDSVIKRIKMDLNPDVEHYRNTYQRVRDDVAPLDFSSLEFAPVITRPRSWITYEGDEPLWINKEFAYIYGKTESGEDVYIEARYKDRRDAVNSPSYKARLKAEGKEKADILLKNLLNRSGIDHWDIVVV